MQLVLELPWRCSTQFLAVALRLRAPASGGTNGAMPRPATMAALRAMFSSRCLSKSLSGGASAASRSVGGRRSLGAFARAAPA